MSAAPEEIAGRTVFFPHDGIHLHAMLTGCGKETRRSTFYCLDGRKRRYNSAIWQLTLEGEGELEYEGSIFRLRPGDAMCVLTPQNHCYRLPPDSAFWKHLFLSFSGEEIMRLWRGLIEKHGPVIPVRREFSPSRNLAEEILSIAENRKITGPYHASELAYRFVMTFLSETEDSTHPDSERFVRDALRFCERHYAEDISVSDIADAAGYSRSHFTRQFTLLYGKTPAEYLREVRFGHAALMLRQTRLSIKEIASVCGFPDASHFCRTFRLRYGASPEGFRKGL